MQKLFFIHESADEYHARARNGEFISSHLLADFRESPALYHKKIFDRIEEPESPAFILGQAAHCLILEGRHAFDRDYLIADDIGIVIYIIVDALKVIRHISVNAPSHMIAYNLSNHNTVHVGKLLTYPHIMEILFTVFTL